MKKLILPVLAVALVAVAVGGYLFQQSRTTDDLTAGVPADTLFYGGTRGAGPWMDALRSLGVAALPQKQLVQSREQLAELGPAGRMAYGLYAAYLARFAKGEPIAGLGESPSMATYTIGLVPTVRMTLDDPDAFRSFIDEAEELGEVRAETGSYEGVSLRSYPLILDGEASRAALVVAVHDNAGAITLDVPEFRDEVLPLALGLKAPGESLADSGMLEHISTTHNLAGAVSFFNHRSIVAALSGDGLAARMLTELAGKRSGDLEPLRTPACREDLAAMTEVSPLTVFGWQADTESGGPTHIKGVTEINDASLIQSLGRLRGHMPGFLREASNRPLLSLALALDLSKPGPVAADLWKRFTKAPFQCRWLVSTQQQLRGTNPAGIAMATMMFSSIRGVSLSLYDISAQEGAGASLESIDALLTISTEDPGTLIALAQGFVPALAGVTFPADGSPVAVPGSMGIDGTLMASVTGTHITLFTGSRAGEAANTLRNEGLDSNGLFFFAADYQRMASLLLDHMETMQSAAASQGTDPETLGEMRDSFQRLSDLNLRVSETVDISDKGIVLDATVVPASRQ